MRIEHHPILDFEEKRKEQRIVSFTFEGKEYKGVEGEPIAAALCANNIYEFHDHGGRKRGLFCAVGNCSSCMMNVNNVTNVRVCVEPLKENMVVRRQTDKGSLYGGTL